MKKKIEYLWMYYKIWLLVPLLLVGAIWLGCTMYKGINTPVLLNIAVAGGNSQNAGALEQGFREYAGLKEADGTVRVQANIPEDGGDITSKTALTTLFGANAVDVLVCSKEVYEEYESQGGFEGEPLVLEAPNIFTEEGVVTYEKTYVAVPVNCQHGEMAEEFLEYVQKHLTNTVKTSTMLCAT